MARAGISCISSMATRGVLDEMSRMYRSLHDVPVAVESVGGVDAARRVQAGETFDVVVLAADALDKLMAAGHLLPGSLTPWVRSGVSMAVRADAVRPDTSSEQALMQTVLAARSVGYSTGPSGVALARLFERWGIAETIRAKTIQAPPGVPVASLVAKGDVELGFQQLSELLNAPGIDIVGPMPEPLQIITTFSAGIGARCADQGAARALLDFMASPAVADCKRRHGMEPI